jgi:hypothetical protein
MMIEDTQVYLLHWIHEWQQKFLIPYRRFVHLYIVRLELTISALHNHIRLHLPY